MGRCRTYVDCGLIERGVNTIDEKKLIDEIRECVDHKRLDDIPNDYWKLSELEFLISRQPKVNNWIPCSERLPDKHRGVFQVTIIRLKDNYKWVQNMLWNFDEWKWWEEDEEEIDVENYTVVAWQPLPEPYKKEVRCEYKD